MKKSKEKKVKGIEDLGVIYYFNVPVKDVVGRFQGLHYLGKEVTLDELNRFAMKKGYTIPHGEK